MTQIIDMSEPGLFQTMSSYYQSTKFWVPLMNNPLHASGARKEIARYKYLKDRVLGNIAA